MMSKEALLSSIVVIAAIISLGTAIFDWNWAMKSDEARPVVDLVGRRNTRIFYAFLGLGFAVVGVLILKGVLPMPERR